MLSVDSAKHLPLVVEIASSATPPRNDGVCHSERGRLAPPLAALPRACPERSEWEEFLTRLFFNQSIYKLGEAMGVSD